MGVTAFRITNTYRKRCELCHKQTHFLYRVTLGNDSYNFCSGMHAQQAATEYQNKIDKGITPDNPNPIEEDEETGAEYAE